ncbi:MAG: SDR family NAD(P)-dependent oxidoreductase [Pseudomonadales bacterium]|nr:SDR family NAD(P)-dependent oxidoreductase [Pseudomonadales bacterium]
MNNLKRRVAFVTGAASGIGLGMTRAFLGAGMRVMLADIERQALDRATVALRTELPPDRADDIAAVVVDVAERQSVFAAAEATLAAFGKVHVVCNNAGVTSGGLIEETTEGDWHWVVGVNFLGVVHGCQAFIPHIKRQGEGGHVVNTASMAGVLGAMPAWAPYNSTKFAVVGLTEVIRQEGREGGYGASVLCPGGVATNIYRAPRNRSERYGPQRSTVARDVTAEDIGKGLDPDVVGRLVLEAILADRLFVFTDPRMRGRVERRHAKMLADFDWAARSDALTRAGAPGT